MISNLKKCYAIDRQNFKKNAINTIILLTLVLAIFISLICYDLSTPEMYYRTDKSENIVGPIYNGFTVSQTFVSQKRVFRGVAVKFATYMTTPEGCLHVIITDLDTDTVALDITVDASTISDNSYFFFESAKIKNCKNHKFRLEITGENGYKNIDRPTTLWASGGNTYEGELTYNGDPRDFDLNLHIYSSKFFGFNEILAIIAFLSVTVFIINRFYKECIKVLEENKEENSN